MKILIQNTYIGGKPCHIARLDYENGARVGYYASTRDEALQRLLQRHPEASDAETTDDICRIPIGFLSSETFDTGRQRIERWCIKNG